MKSKNVSKNKSIDVKLYLKSYTKHDMVDKITRFIRQRGFQYWDQRKKKEEKKNYINLLLLKKQNKQTVVVV